MKDEDIQLMLKSKEGDIAAFEKVFRKYKQNVIKRVAFGFRDTDYFFLKIRGAFAGT